MPKIKDNSSSVVVLGAGLSGLTAARDLLKNGVDVTVLEREIDPGGLAASFEFEGEKIPHCYHHIMENDKPLHDMIKDLSLDTRLYAKKAEMGFFYKRRLYQLKGAIDLLKFKPLTFFERIRFGLFGLSVMFRKDWKKYDNINAKVWLEKKLGMKIFNVVFKPLLVTKFGRDWDKIAASWVGYRLTHKESSGFFYYLKRGGISSIVESLAEDVEKLGGKIIYSAEVKQISVKSGKVDRISYSLNGKKKEIVPNAVISTIPIPVLSNTLKGMPESYMKQLAKIKYKASISGVVALTKKITPYYWLNFLDGDLSFRGIFDHATINPKANHGKSLLYLFNYCDTDEAIYKLRDEEMKVVFRKDLEKIFPDIEKYIKWIRIYRMRYSKAVYSSGYVKHKPGVKTPASNMFLSGVCTMPPMRNMGAAIKSGKDTVSVVLNEKLNGELDI